MGTAILRKASGSTNLLAGDGTTTTTLLTSAILK
jgi:chaperonin GroEL (HSP60 family)